MKTRAITPPKIPHAQGGQSPPEPPLVPPPPPLNLPPDLPPPLPPRAALIGLHREMSTHRPSIQHPLGQSEQRRAIVVIRLVGELLVALSPLS